MFSRVRIILEKIWLKKSIQEQSIWNIRRLESILTEEMEEQIPGKKKTQSIIINFLVI